jgi:hypothetical protein
MTRLAAVLLAAVLVAAAGCIDRVGDALVICHNANCTQAASIAGDDSLPALDASLALRTANGRAVFDGVEIDSVWDRGVGRCVFSHGPDPRAADLAAAARRVAAYVAGAPADVAGHGGVFYMKIELKADVGGGASHTPDETAAHVACVTAAARAVVAAGAASHNVVVPIFDSDDPELLAAIDPAPFDAAAGCLFETNRGAPLPPGFVPQILTVGWYEGAVDLAWAPDAMAVPRSASGHRIEGGLAIWARSPSAEETYAILTRGPRFIVVNNIEEVRGLLDELAPQD